MGQMHRVDDPENDPPAGLWCGVLGASGIAFRSGDRSQDFWTVEAVRDGGLVVEIGSYDEVLERRSYGAEFFAANDADRFTVVTRAGDEYVFACWGGSECETCPPLEYAAVPGDPWGCGTEPAEVALPEN